jgi:hypothetical protein
MRIVMIVAVQENNPAFAAQELDMLNVQNVKARRKFNAKNVMERAFILMNKSILKFNYIMSILVKSKTFCIFLSILYISLQSYGQKKKPIYEPIKNYKCTTFVYNLTADDSKMSDICFSVIKGEFSNLNDFTNNKKKENEVWRFEISIKDNKTQSLQNYKASFYIYENGSEITQYHPLVENEEFKAVIYDKLRNSWQILLFQNDEYKILSSYSAYHYVNAFDIKPKRKSSISY